ncbi:MAG: DNA-binding protein [Clostridiales bacterium]|nr:DNA-binding protein [uncultured Blautia sp.]MBS6195142.1 DNA-binding protein [Clostridiales bacterium]
MSKVQEKMYMNVEDVCTVLGVSKAYAYKLMKGYNEELKAKGFLVIPGKISTKFLAEKIYGMKVEG